MDTSQLIVDLSKQFSQLTSEINTHIDQLKEETKMLLPEQQQQLFEQIGYSLNNTHKTYKMYQKLVSVPYRINLLSEDIGQNKIDLSYIQNELQQIGNDITDIEQDTQRYLQ